MTYKAYIDNIRAKTGKDPEYFQKQAKEKGLVSHVELLSWLKSDCGLGHGHANAIILYITDPELAKKKLVEDAKKENAKKKSISCPRPRGLVLSAPARCNYTRHVSGRFPGRSIREGRQDMDGFDLEQYTPHTRPSLWYLSCPRYFFASLSTCSSAPLKVTALPRPRITATLKALAGSQMSSATLGFLRTFLCFWLPSILMRTRSHRGSTHV